MEGLGHGVVHLPGETGPFGAHRLRRGQACLDGRQGLGGGAEAEHQVAEGGADGSRDDAEAGQQQGFREFGAGVLQGGLDEQQDQ